MQITPKHEVRVCKPFVEGDNSTEYGPVVVMEPEVVYHSTCAPLGIEFGIITPLESYPCRLKLYVPSASNEVDEVEMFRLETLV